MNDKEEKDQTTVIASDEAPIEIDVFVDSEENEVYVKFSNFEELEDAEEYADYLIENLPLLLFQSKTLH